MTMMISSLLPQRQSPLDRRLFLRRLSLALTVLTLLAGVTACQPAITVLQPAVTTSPLPAATVAPAERGLSVIGVDFDPALDSASFVSNGGVSLLVAISNSGQRSETEVEVTAELQDPTGRLRPIELVSETVRVKSLAPGGVEVVRFSQVTDLPLRSSYKLVVSVAPAPGETDLEDNTRTYDILVGDAR
jgi:hypothetical protein